MTEETYQYMQLTLVQKEHVKSIWEWILVGGPYIVPEGMQVMRLTLTTAEPGNFAHQVL
jgi:hypothetical protein